MGKFMVCKNCGANVKCGLMFCEKCGANVETGIVPTAHPIGLTIKKQKCDNIKKILKRTAIAVIVIIIGISVFFLVTRMQQ